MSGSKLVAFPELVMTAEGGEVEVSHPVTGASIEASEDVQELLAFLAEPRSEAELEEAYGLELEDLAPFTNRLMIVREDELPRLRRGLLRPAAPAVGVAAEWHEVLESGAPGDRVILGAPVDVVAGGEGGARHGPREIRHAVPRWMRGPMPELVNQLDLERAYRPGERACFDAGNVVYRADETYADFGWRLGRAVGEALDRELFPIVLGGDHSVSWYALQPHLARHARLGIVHVDAHSDLHVDPGPDVQVEHHSVFDFICQHPSVSELVQIGLRSSDAPAPGTARVDDVSLRLIPARRARRMSPEEMLAGLPRDIPWYLSFDIDALDPSVAPETGTQLVGGLSVHDALELVDYVSRELPLVGADLVEVAAGTARINQAAHAAGELLSLLILAGTPASPLEGHYYRPGP